VGDPASALDIPFDLLEKIASGAFGEVWRGVTHGDGSVVAVKRLHAHLADSGVMARFAREAELLSQLRSEHVVAYVAHGRDREHRPWLATQWLEGEDLATWRAGESHTVREALQIVRDAALGAAAMHDAEMVHRDIKPGNLIVGVREDGSLRSWIVDLGIADVFAQRLAGHGPAVEIQQARQLGDFLQNGGDAARAIHVLHVIRRRRRDLADVRATLGNAVDALQIVRHAGLARDRQRMQHGVRAAAHRHVEHEGVVERRARDHIARLEILADHLNDPSAGRPP